MNLAEMVVAFNPLPTAQRARRTGIALLFRLGSAVVSLIICIVIYYTASTDWTKEQVWWLFGIWGAISLIWLAISLWSWVAAKLDQRRIGQGPAVTLSPIGITIKGRRFAWPDVSRIWMKPALSGVGPKLIVVGIDGEWQEIPFSFLDATPGAIDSALLAYGQPPLDTRPNDSLA